MPQDCKVVRQANTQEVTATRAVVAGEVVAIRQATATGTAQKAKIGVALHSAASGDKLTVGFDHVCEFSKATNLAVEAGNVAIFDVSTRAMVASESAQAVLIGRYWDSAASTAPTVHVHVNPYLTMTHASGATGVIADLNDVDATAELGLGLIVNY